MDYQKEKETALAALITASRLCEQIRTDSKSTPFQKADTTPVTIADLGAQGIISRALTGVFADDPIIGEEDATLLEKPDLEETLADLTAQVQSLIPETTSEKLIEWINRGKGKISPRYWTLDPIDGTKGYIRGDQYAIALALIEAGEVQLGVLACPALPFDFRDPDGDKGVLFVAVKGEGTEMIAMDGNKSQFIQIQPKEDVKEMIRLQSVESGNSDRTQQIRLDRALGLIFPPKDMDSQAKYGALARGEGDLYLRMPFPEKRNYAENIWDHAAGSIVVTEAGGKVTDLRGKPLDFSLGAKLKNNMGILASNSQIHPKVIQEIIHNS